jgi:putative ATPase
LGKKKRHPVQQEYLPPHLIGEQFLKMEGDVSDKAWDEKLLKRWEKDCNGGRPWSGRLDNSTDSGKNNSL